MDKTDALRAFAALAQETHLDVLRLLLEAGDAGLLAGEIGDRLGVRQNTMPANLSILHAAGLVRNRREGRAIRYAADFDGVRGLLGYLRQECCGRRPELCQPLIGQVASAS